MVVVKVLPFPQLLVEVLVISVGQQLIELLLVGQMRALYFPIQPRCPRFDVAVRHPQVLNVPVKLGLELVTIICPHCMNAEREPLYDMINKVNGIGL